MNIRILLGVFGLLGLAAWIIFLLIYFRNDPFMIVLILAFAAISLFFFALYYGYLFYRKYRFSNRRVEMETFAARTGWIFKPVPAPADTAILEHVKLYDGFRPKIMNFMSGTMNNRRIVVFDICSSKKRNNVLIYYYYTVFGIVSSHLNLPAFYLTPKGFSLINLEENFDIDFLHRPHFSDKYLLFSNKHLNMQNFFNSSNTDEYWVRQLFDEGMLSFYENDTSGLCTAGGGNCLFAYTRSVDRFKFAKPDDFNGHFNYLFSIFPLFYNASQRFKQ